MLLYLLRHADPVSHADSDAARTLSEKGVEQAKRVGRFCQRHQIGPDVILSSPLRRAEQTARLAAEEMGGVEVRIAEFLRSGMEPDAAVVELKSFTKFNKVMIVGHEPDFSSLAARLVGTGPGKIKLSKASLTAIELDENNLSNGRLIFSIPVSLMPA